MKSLKDLYIAAKNSYEESAAVKAYTSQIDSYLESNPYLYFSNLSYVIESSYGLETLIPFIEKYGIPFQGISTVKHCLAQCKNKCKWSGKDDSSYTEAEEFLESYIHTYKNSYIMYEAFEDELDERYIEAYYKNFPKIRNGKVNISPLLERYGNGCIPDLLIYTEADRSILESIYDTELPSAREKRIQNQWIADSLKDFSHIDNDIQNVFTKESLEYKVEEKRRQNEQFYRESMLLGETENSYAYTEENIQNIEDLISYKEYRMVSMASDENYFTEVSHSNLKECYHAGINMANGHVVNIVYKLDPEELTRVFDTYDQSKDPLFSKVFSTIKRVIRKKGHGDFESRSTPIRFIDLQTKKVLPDKKLTTIGIVGFVELYRILVAMASMNKLNTTETRIVKQAIRHMKSRNNEPFLNIWSFKDNDKLFAMMKKYLASKIKPREYIVEIGKKETRPSFKSTLYPTSIKDVFINMNMAALTITEPKGLKSPSQYKARHSRGHKYRNSKTLNDIQSFVKESALINEPYTEGFSDVLKKGYNVAKQDALNSNKNESVGDIQNYIYSLYEELSPMITEETADSVVPNLPQANTAPKENSPEVPEKEKEDSLVMESLFDSNTNNKKSGEMPDYLKNNHDMSYGEDDDIPSKDTSYKRSPKEWEHDKLDDITPYGYVDDDDDDNDNTNTYDHNDNDETKSTGSKDITIPKSSSTNTASSVYNYYYNYNNSNNTTTSHTNTNSFNKHHSIKDDHSSHVRDNHSINKSVDDHSKYKRANLYPNHKEEEIKKESFDFSLNLPSYMEEVGDADDMKPESDNSIQDTLHDIDRNITSKQQSAKKTVQSVANTGKLLMRPFTRTAEWVNNMINNWKDKSENAIKEKMADPHQRSSLFSAIKKSIIVGSLYKAGLLLNPVLIFLAIAKKWNDHSKMGRLRNEMIGELKTELSIIDEKIRDADRNGDNKAKYQMMRFKNELSKKLIRVGGTPNMRKII